MKKILLILGLFISINSFSQTYPNNEIGQYEDMLTPEYYLTLNGYPFRNEVNMFVHFARLSSFHHPLEDSIGQMPQFTINRGFGDGIGAGGTSQHHPAIDLHIGNSDSLVNLYAAHDGSVTVYRDAPKYRHYLSITKNIEDSLGSVIGKMVTLYAHIDLDLDSIDNLLIDGQFVSKGDLVSKHLYSGTMGGPHLHFEIRYYRPSDLGNEDFYGWVGGNPDFTSPSTGSWLYGDWNPDIGYGFANPDNHLNNSIAGIINIEFSENIKVFPNPTLDFITIKFTHTRPLLGYQNIRYAIYDLTGELLEHKDLFSVSKIDIDLSDYKSGIYLINLIDEMHGKSSIIKILKQ